MLVIGEVHTALLQHHASVSISVAARILSLRLGDGVRSYARPISAAVSPDLYTGLDCRLTAEGGQKLRGIGTAVSFATITGGQLAQATTMAEIRVGEASRRLPWSHYLSCPGVIETLTPVPSAAVANGWLGVDAGSPNLGAISDRLLDTVQRSPQLRRPAPLRAARTRLRWVLAAADGPATIALSLEDDGLRTLRLSGTGLDPRLVAEFCADLALHDWLLTTLLDAIERSGLETGAGPLAINALRPAIENLLHHWMPAARIDPVMLPYWHSLEQSPGLARQWTALVSRLRDQMAISTIGALSAVAVPREEKV